MVVDGDGQRALRRLLADDVLLEEAEDLLRLGEVEFAAGFFAGLSESFFDDLVAEFHALVADVDTRTSNELLDLLLALATEGTLEQIGAFTYASHPSPSSFGYLLTSLTCAGDKGAHPCRKCLHGAFALSDAGPDTPKGTIVVQTIVPFGRAAETT